MTISATTASRRLSRRGLLGLAGGATAALAAGCARGYTQVSGSGVPAKYAGRTHIIAWHSYGSSTGKALGELVDAFNQEQSDIYVEAQFQGSYEATQQKLEAAMIAREIPDLCVLSEVTWRAVQLADGLEPLNDYFDSELQPGDYIQQFITEGTIKGKIWWLPFARSTPLFYFNRNVFKAAGLPDRAPKTWDEYAQWSPAIKKVQSAAGGQVMPLALSGQYSAWYFQGNMWEWKANYSHALDITLDSANGMAAGTWMADFVQNKKFGYLSASSSVDFGNGAAAASLMSTASLAQVTQLAQASKFDLGTGFIPRHEAFGCPTGGSGWGIMVDAPTERKQAAFEFLKFLGRPANAASWTMATGYLPIVTKAQEDSRLTALMKKDPNFTTSLKQLPLTKTQDLGRLVIPNASNFMDQSFETMYSSTTSAETVFSRLARKMRKKAALIEENFTAHYG